MSVQNDPRPSTTDADFLLATEPLRREITAHCYRMMGSHHDAEDLTQETYLRAWRGFAGFDGRASVRTWLHRIATNTCLSALESTSRRPLPSGLGTDAFDPTDTLLTDTEVPWLQPFPGAAPSERDDPAQIIGVNESIRLAFVAALQHLPARQRAVLILRDVLAWRASEVADTVGLSVASVNSLLQRARATLREVDPDHDAQCEPSDATTRATLARWVAAFEEYDVEAIVSMFTTDAIWEMPPFTGWYRGGEQIGTLIRGNCPASAPGDQILVPTVANGQPAFGLYMRGEDGQHRPFQLQVLDLTTDGQVRHVVAFFDDAEAMFARFGLPQRPPSR
ncbi:sigma-70 family RNA polymerase sigma factor [Williamsia sp. CHRR-6]|uniref:sigma-70 family RNA polymerase sigma factor n=1 Tax=Williamsia sp. CHRR-6 TaxID=2835871 RepID=UPI001BDB55FC|nr:sigma-70 family RNA polymerase sigma factor [Williamsia sp. CHRR-6]MBT0567535.1 sigma-70 family RNA polymerase sigma factor [Williamsia sp. CHRR-6]